jgi:L,D-peptidoglycan transpeptidase YkuD (ErfK/YbiS/YcfS/YnhG family)
VIAVTCGTGRRAAGAALAAALVVVTLATLAAPGGTVPAAAHAVGASGTVPAYHPSRLTHLGDARQVVVVTSRRWDSSRARLRAYELRADGTWSRVLDAGPVWVGRNGFVRADRRRQDTSTTPAGTFGLPRAFGTASDPGTALPYRWVDGDDWWPYDPRDPGTYNVWQGRRSAGSDWRTAWAEDLSSYGRQYRHAVVVDYNLPSGVHRSGSEWLAREAADTRRGGGIFLHVQKASTQDRATAGCVAMPRERLLRLLHWLDPAKAPVVVAGPRPAITRM